MKTAIIAFCDIYMPRARLLRDYYESRGDEVTIFTSSFSHQRLAPYDIEDGRVVQVYQKPYKKYLSVQRMLGYRGFADRVTEAVEKARPDRIHCMVPSNFLCRKIAGYKKAHPETELIFDVDDLWPESFPVEGIGRIWPVSAAFGMWRKLRDDSLGSADHVVTECGLFQEYLPVCDASTLYWALDDIDFDESVLNRLPDPNTFLYMGTINDLLDLDALQKFFAEFRPEDQAVIHIIGGGPAKDKLMEMLKKAAVKVIDHGYCYDEKKKGEIMASCRFGINMMKPMVKVGLTTKSIDYLRSGMPLLNSIGADTKELCDEEGCGFNVDASVAERIRSQSDTDYLQMKKNARRVYESHFSGKAFENRLSDILSAANVSESL